MKIKNTDHLRLLILTLTGFLVEANDDILPRAGARTATKWTNLPDGNNWNIPYTIEDVGQTVVAAIREAIDDVHVATCLRFTPKTREKDFVRFINGSGCFAHIGRRTDDPNTIILGEGCDHKGAVLHEMMHTFGFYHEHARPDRDEYINIVEENILPHQKYNFKKLTEDEILSFGSAYDVQSIMHYPEWSFTSNGRYTIVDTDGERLQGLQVNKSPLKAQPNLYHDFYCLIQQQDDLSPSDIKQINSMYECDKNPKVAINDFVPWQSVCADKSQKCSTLSSRGKCKGRQAWMAENCRKSCNFCGKVVRCEEVNKQHCEDMKSRCKRSPRIRKKCPRACGIC